MSDLIRAERVLNYSFKDKKLLQRALTAPSASPQNNQLLECFGDAILEFIVSEKLYFEEKSEGRMTVRRANVVSDRSLTAVSVRLGLDKLLVRDEKDLKNKKAIPSVYEAIVAAIYLDGGMDEAKKFVLSTLDFSAANAETNYKGDLQEYLQGEGKPVPDYSAEEIEGKLFLVKVKLFGKTFTGKGESIKGAEQLAAKAALEYLNGNKS